jgi:hypothetical protein
MTRHLTRQGTILLIGCGIVLVFAALYWVAKEMGVPLP